MTPTNTIQSAVNKRIDKIIYEPTASALVGRFYIPNEPFAGESFDLLGLDRKNVNKFVVSDFLAINLMGISVRPDTIRKILGDDTSRLSRMLTHIDDVDIWKAEGPVLDAAGTLFDVLGKYPVLTR